MDDDEDELSLEADSDFTASNRSCINLPSACPGFSVELVEPVDEVEEVEELELSEVELSLPSGGGPLGGGGIEIPIWLSEAMMLCINLSSPPDVDLLPETWVLELVPLLSVWSNRERNSVYIESVLLTPEMLMACSFHSNVLKMPSREYNSSPVYSLDSNNRTVS